MKNKKTLLDKLKIKYNKYIDTLVLFHFEVVRFVDIIEDEEDIYYVIDDGKKIFHLSALIKLIFLEKKLSRRDYNELVRIWNLNNKNTAI